MRLSVSTDFGGNKEVLFSSAPEKHRKQQHSAVVSVQGED